ncbi:hypothetical protein POM88_049106 [Heracleum sosnowskyi]|uniref:BED-type domain-containing protein n=1 Tax=Heracleum sosnowskyi TaxID=360622 RepID=A0AAD8GV15_9APIA|nr:hypothetical protein POM88_049106 [Heracleum sosnowskyi]
MASLSQDHKQAVVGVNEVYESLSEDEADNRENENENDEVPTTEGSVKPAKKGSKRKRSIAWETFSFTTSAENEVKCKKCSYTIAYNSSFGTGNMLKHQKLCATSSDVRQMIISKSQGTMMVHNGAFDPKVFRDMITDAVDRIPTYTVVYDNVPGSALDNQGLDVMKEFDALDNDANSTVEKTELDRLAVHILFCSSVLQQFKYSGFLVADAAVYCLVLQFRVFLFLS